MFTARPAKTKSKTENLRYKNADAVKVPNTEEKTASQALIWLAYRTALSVEVLVKMLMPLRIGKETQVNKKPSKPNDIIL